MTVLLGVDTGGTYTDAVLIQNDQILASAKSLTTRQDLAVGIQKAVDSVLAQSQIAPEVISMTSLSTTLATNALVEGQGGRVALVFIGFGQRDLERQGLGQALGGDPVILIDGGHDHAGSERNPLDLNALAIELAEIDASVTGYAIAGQFATRNPAHEIAVRDFIRENFAKPATCSHDLSAKLGGPKRAMTAVLNARLIGMIDQLIRATSQFLTSRNIQTPLMVVRGDGALISADQAREKPIETILSGPAASIVGASWLTGQQDAMISDIGGTTTDIALLRNGRPQIDPDGARVGGLRTMVEAVAMRTFGLGGDSEVHLVQDGLAGGVVLGPRRLVPVSLLAQDFGEIIHPVLEKQLNAETPPDEAGRFAYRLMSRPALGLNAREETVLARLSETPIEISAIVQNRLEGSALKSLVGRGIVMLSGLTPSDAAHQLGIQTGWDKDAAEMALRLFGRKRTGSGNRIAQSSEELAQRIINQLTEQTAQYVMETAFAEDSEAIEGRPTDLAGHELTKLGQIGHRNIVKLHAGLNVPLVGLGASARTYYGAVGKVLSCETVLPDNGHVANAIGAVVGQITMRETGEIDSDSNGGFRAYLADGPAIFASEKDALAALEKTLATKAELDARNAGAIDIQTQIDRDIEKAEINGQSKFVKAIITVSASGRPRIAD